MTRAAAVTALYALDVWARGRKMDTDQRARYLEARTELVLLIVPDPKPLMKARKGATG